MADEKQLTTQREPRADLSAGGSVRAIIPQSFESVYRMAQVIVAAGMAPKSMDTVEKATVAILHGMEIGMSPMVALQSIAIVNGTPTIYGDGMLALVRNSGLLASIEEEVQVDTDGEPTISICRVRRKGEPNEIVGSFTRVEATRAGLWNKQGPWTQYRRRMMQFRARSWALRDAFPDVLRGLGMTEEIEDMPIDVTPRSTARFTPPEPRRSDATEPEPAPAKEPDPPPPAEPTARTDWSVGEVTTGQETVIKRLTELCGEAATLEEADAIEDQNAERIAKITGVRGDAVRRMFRDKRRALGGG